MAERNKDILQVFISLAERKRLSCLQSDFVKIFMLFDMLKKIKKRFQGEEFGHETVSRVVATEKNIEEFQVGERVYPYPLFAKDDTSRAGTIGGFSEYILVPNAKRNHSLYSVDDRIPDRIACLTEPFTILYTFQ